MADPADAARSASASDSVGLTDASREQMERFRAAHHTQVLTILLSDLEGSTKQQTTLGNVRAAELVQAHRGVFRATLAGMDGEEVETAGDSFLVVFATPSEAVRFALRMQAAMRAARAGVVSHLQLAHSGHVRIEDATPLPQVRVGIHQGQVVVERHEEGPKRLDVYGLQISAAARITDLARGGQVLCSRAVFDDARAILSGADLAGLEPVVWCNHGPYRFKGVADAYEVCEAGERTHAPLAPPAATAKGWPAEQAAEELGWRPAVGVTVPGTNWVLEERLGGVRSAQSEGDSAFRVPRSALRYRGEFGEVWEAFNPGDKSREVFKFCFKRDRLAALKREARLLKRLHRYRHPNLVEVYDVTEGDKPPYYLEMEYVDGPSLDEWLAADPPLAERLGVVAQVADALDTVHAAGIYHRDIKPSNILLARREDGALVAKLSDFGLGAAEDENVLRSIYVSRVDGVAGTWDYMAPEVRRGEVASARSDLYSLGVTLYQIACGDLERTLGDWERHVPSEVLREDIARCIATDPAARWASAGELSRALRSHGERLAERRLRREREAQRRRIRRLGLISAVAAGAALILAALGAYAFVQRRIARRQEAIAQQERDEAVKARRRTEAELYFSNVLLATRQIEQDRYDPARDVLWASPEGLRNWEWGHLLARCSTELLALDASGEALLALAFSPDGGRLVAASTAGKAYVWDVAAGRERFVLPAHSAWLTAAAFSPDGARILTACATDGVARLWGADTGKPLAALEGHCPALIVGRPDDPFLADGSRATLAEAWAGKKDWDVFVSVKDAPLALRHEGGPASRFAAQRRELLGALFVLLEESRGIAAARFSPDGARVLTAGGDGTARLWDARSGACTHTHLGRARRETPAGRRIESVEDAIAWLLGVGLTAAAFSPDGSRVATGAQDGTVEVWDAATGKPLWSERAHKGPVTCIAFWSAGQQMATAAGQRPSREMDAWLPPHPTGPPDPAAPAHQNVRVWEVATGRATGGFRCAPVRGMVFVADGTRLAVAHEDKGLPGSLWDPPSGRLLGVLPGRPLLASADGAQVLTAVPGGVALAEVATGKLTLELRGHGGEVNAAAFRPPDKGPLLPACIATASADGTARLWETVTPPDAARLTPLTFHVPRQAFRTSAEPGQGQPAEPGAPAAPAAEAVVLSKDKTRLVAVARRRATAWDAATGAVVATLAHPNGVGAGIDVSPDGRRVAVPLVSGDALLWEPDANRIVHTYREHKGPVHSARFSPDGQSVATASADCTARIWSAASGRTSGVLEGHTDIVWDAVFSPDGARVATVSSDHTARVWDARSSKLLATMTGHGRGLHDAAFSADGARLATTAPAPDASARVWDAHTGALLATLRVDETDSPWRAAFTPDARRVLVATVTRSDILVARLWDVAGVAQAPPPVHSQPRTAVPPVHTFRGRKETPFAACLSPDGTRAAVADDTVARVWDTASGRELAVLEGHTATITLAAFSADGLWLVTAALDGTVRLWRAAPWRSDAVPGDASRPWRQRYAEWRLGQYHRWQATLKRGQ